MRLLFRLMVDTLDTHTNSDVLGLALESAEDPAQNLQPLALWYQTSAQE